MNSMKWALWLLVLFSCLAFGQGATTGRTNGQVLYLPIYSHIWHGDVARGGPRKTLVSVSVSIRNTDPSKSILITSAQYFDTNGKRMKEYVSAPRTIAPMGTYEIFIPRSDDTGGSGANFVIAWTSGASVNAPLVEAVHADLPGGLSLAFITSARQILVD
jgi:uncharacterized protein DUF3124